MRRRTRTASRTQSSPLSAQDASSRAGNEKQFSRGIKRWSARFALVLLVSIFAVTSYPRTASAAYDYCSSFTRLGRNGCNGYFTNQNFNSGFIEGWNLLNCEFSTRGCVTINGTPESKNYALPTGINTATLFENEIDWYLGSGYAYNHVGAAFLVDTMLGRPGSSFGSVTAGINYALANFNNWKTNYIDYYASQPDYAPGWDGWINWNSHVTLAAGTINTMHSCAYNVDCTQDNINSGSNDGKDIIFFRNPPTEDSHLIIFHNPDNSSFQIRRECANVVGNLPNMNTLTPKPPTIATLSCDGDSPSVMAPDPNQAFTMTVNMQYAPAGSATTSFGSNTLTVQLTGPAGFTTITKTTTAPSISNSTGELSYVLNVPATGVAGNYGLTWKVTGANPVQSCSDTIQIAYQPYFTVRGGDISAGQGFGNGCTENPGADIDGENQDNGSTPANYFGASTSNAALATGAINQFATDTTNNIPSNLGGSSDGISTNQPSGLTFANNNPAGPQYGGLVLASWPGAWCAPDYSASADPPSGTFNPASLVSGTYTLSGNSIGGFTVPAGAHIAVIASADVFISNDIKFASYSNLSQVPQFTLLVKGGSIYVDNNVKELHGFYDAQPDAAAVGGSIYTCATAPSTPATDYANCNFPLTFYGAVAAGQIIPGRTVGDISKGTTVTDVPAEQFVYTPELWLGAVTLPTETCAEDPTQPSCAYQSYTTLPPVL